MKKIIFIKLGGSFLTDKAKVNKARFIKIKRLSKEIKDLQKKYSLAIFTGAGSFGHPIAQKYKNNLKDAEVKIRNACKKINKIVVSALINEGQLKAVSLTPSKISEYKNNKLIKLSYNFIVSLLEKDIIPVFHADLVNDKKLGISILSMDKFLVDTAIYLKKNSYKIEKAVFVGVTPVIVANQKIRDRRKRIVHKITRKNFRQLEEIFYKGKGIDVSGGIKYKVEQALRLADIGIKSYITDNLFRKGTLIS